MDVEYSQTHPMPDVAYWKLQAAGARLLAEKLSKENAGLVAALRSAESFIESAYGINEGAAHADPTLAEVRKAMADVSPPTRCTWTRVPDDDYNTYETSCGQEYCLEADGPAENGMKYCCYCGKALTAVEPDA